MPKQDKQKEIYEISSITSSLNKRVLHFFILRPCLVPLTKF